MQSKDLSGIAGGDFEERQQVLDVEKWLASERAGRDLCGTMPYCAFCFRGEIYPCAKAELRYKMRLALREMEEEAAAAETPAEEDAPTQETQEILCGECAEEIAGEMLADESEGKTADPVRAAAEIMGDAPASPADISLPEGYEAVTRYRRTFKAKLVQNERAQDYYTELKNAFTALSGVKSRLSQGGENFRIGRQKIAKVNFGGKTLTLYLALDPAEYEESKYRFSDVSEKKSYAQTPMKLRITSARALRHAKELIGDMAEKYSLSDVGCIYTDYHFPYRTDEQLIAKGLIKPYTAIVKKRK